MAQKLETNLKSTTISLFFSVQHLGLHAKLPKGKQNEKSPVFHWKAGILYPYKGWAMSQVICKVYYYLMCFVCKC